jgi:hypothetical protein
MEVSRIRVHPKMKFTLAAFRSFLFWRQRSLASTTRLNCQRHFFRRRWRNGGTVERCTYVRCTALLIGLHTRNGSTVSLFDP